MNILLCGAGGRMGGEVARLALARGDTVTPVDPRRGLPDASFADILIDFSHPDATAALLAYETACRSALAQPGRTKGRRTPSEVPPSAFPSFAPQTFRSGSPFWSAC